MGSVCYRAWEVSISPPCVLGRCWKVTQNKKGGFGVWVLRLDFGVWTFGVGLWSWTFGSGLFGSGLGVVWVPIPMHRSHPQGLSQPRPLESAPPAAPCPASPGWEISGINGSDGTTITGRRATSSPGDEAITDPTAGTVAPLWRCQWEPVGCAQCMGLGAVPLPLLHGAPRTHPLSH